MTQIVGDATYIKGEPLSGALSSGQTWVYDGAQMVPTGNEAYKFIDVDGDVLTAAESEDILYLSGVSGIKLAGEAQLGSGANSVRFEVSGLASSQIPHWSAISGMASGGSGIAFSSYGIASGSSGIAVGASGIAVAASGMASGGSGTATQALGVAQGGSGIAVGASGIAAGGSGIAAGASGIAAGASGMALYSSGKLDDTDQTSGIVLSSGNGLTVFSASPVSGQVLKASGTNILTDLYWAADQTASGGGSGSGNTYAFINVQGSIIDANTGDDTLNFSGRSGIRLSALSGAGQGEDVIFAEVSGLVAGQIPNWSEISGMASAASGIAVAAVTPDYIPPRFMYEDVDKIYIPKGRYYKAGFRWRGQFQDVANIAQYWDVPSRLSVRVDSTYASGASPGMIGGAKVNNSWYSVFLVGNSANEVLVLPFVRIKAIGYSAPYTVINPGDHTSAANYEDGFILSSGAWNGYRLVKRSCDAHDGSVYAIADSINATHDEVRISGNLTAELAASDWLQLVPPSTMPCLFLGLIRIDGAGNIGDFRTVASEAVATGDGIKEVVEGRLAWNSDIELIWNAFRGYGVALWMNDDWRMVTPSNSITLSSTAIDIDGNSLTYNSNYDIFAEGDGTPFNFRLVAKKWANDSTRAQSLSRLDGVVVYDKDTDVGRRRRFLGTVRLRNDAGTPKFTDSVTRRFISNMYNLEQVRIAASAQANGGAVSDDSYALWTNWISPGIAAVFAVPQTFMVLAPFNGQTDPANSAGRLSVMVGLDGVTSGVEGNTPDAAGTKSISRQPMCIIEISTAGYHYLDLYRKRYATGTSPLHWLGAIEGTLMR